MSYDMSYDPSKSSTSARSLRHRKIRARAEEMFYEWADANEITGAHFEMGLPDDARTMWLIDAHAELTLSGEI